MWCQHGLLASVRGENAVRPETFLDCGAQRIGGPESASTRNLPRAGVVERVQHRRGVQMCAERLTLGSELARIAGASHDVLYIEIGIPVRMGKTECMADLV